MSLLSYPVSRQKGFLIKECSYFWWSLILLIVSFIAVDSTASLISNVNLQNYKPYFLQLRIYKLSGLCVLDFASTKYLVSVLRWPLELGNVKSISFDGRFIAK